MALDQQVIAIVGGTTGLGLSAAIACQRAGARLCILGREESDLQAALAQLGSAACGIAGDASQAGVSQRLIDLAVSRFGSLNGLYHVAGGSGRALGDGPLDGITIEGWEYTLRLNLTSVFLSNQAAVRQLQKQRAGGSILNLSSVLATSPSPGYFATHAYAAAKAGIEGLTRSCAACYAGQSIRFNALAPGLIRTPMAQRACDDPRIAAFVSRKQPLDGGRIGLPADLDQAVVFLLSDSARFITGQVLAIDGGWGVSEGLP